LDESKNFIEPNSSNAKVTPENWILSPQVGIQLICNSRTKNLHKSRNSKQITGDSKQKLRHQHSGFQKTKYY